MNQVYEAQLAVAFAAPGAMSIFVTCGYLYFRNRREPQLLLWTFSWGLSVASYAAEIWYVLGPQPLEVWESLQLTSAVFLWWGTEQYVGVARRPAVYLLAVAAVGGWHISGHMIRGGEFWFNGVLSLLTGCVYLWCGCLLLRVRLKNQGYRLLGWLLVIWGLYILVYHLVAEHYDYPIVNSFLSGTIGVLVAVSLMVAALEEARQKQIRDLRDVVLTLSAAVGVRDLYTMNHSQNVARLAVLISRELGLRPVEVEEIYLAGLLHDIGKIGISDDILRKPSLLTEEEHGLIKRHPVVGSAILEKAGEIFRPLIPAVRHHHERWDGLGYPDGLKREAIPLAATILAVADGFDAMTSHRPYRSVCSSQEAQEEILRCAGSQFSPEVVRAFVRVVQAVPQGELGDLAADLVAASREADRTWAAVFQTEAGGGQRERSSTTLS